MVNFTEIVCNANISVRKGKGKFSKKTYLQKYFVSIVFRTYQKVDDHLVSAWWCVVAEVTFVMEMTRWQSTSRPRLADVAGIEFRLQRRSVDHVVWTMFVQHGVKNGGHLLANGQQYTILAPGSARRDVNGKRGYLTCQESQAFQKFSPLNFCPNVFCPLLRQKTFGPIFYQIYVKMDKD